MGDHGCQMAPSSLSSRRLPLVAPALLSGRLVLRPLRPADRDDLFAILSDPRVAGRTDIEPLASPHEAAELLSFLAQRLEQDQGIRWAISLAGGDRLIGTAGFPGGDWSAGCAEIGYEVSPEQWGRGIATEAVRRLVTWAVREQGLRRIEANTNPTNEASMAVLRKSGFVEVDAQECGQPGHWSRLRFFAWAVSPTS